MTAKQMEVLRRIIYAVETGGQVYGQADYGAFTEAYENSSNERSITIGAGQWYASEGLQLLQAIKKAGGEGFTAELLAAMESSWDALNVSRTSSLAKAIVAVITTDIGKATQDKLIDEQMEDYVAEAEDLGVTDPQAQAMCANFRHQGGYSAMVRIIAKTAKPYTLDSLYAATLTDTGNQVGAYRSRQKFVYDALAKYMPAQAEAGTGARTAGALLSVLRSWIGFSEANGKYRQILDIYNSHRPLARNYAIQPGDAWCATTVSAAGIKAGMADLIGTEVSCGFFVEIFKAKGIWIEDGTITPEPGYIVLYDWDDATQPNDGWPDHIGVVESVSDGMITIIEGNYNDAVSRRTIPVGWGYIRGYAAPKYDQEQASAPAEEPDTLTEGSEALPKSSEAETDPGNPVKVKKGDKMPVPYTQIGCTGAMVAVVQIALDMLGYELDIDGEFGPDTDKAVRQYQSDRGLTASGTVGISTFRQILKDLGKMTWR